MASTTVSGVGSNIDTAAIVSALVAAEKAPKQKQISTQATLNASKISGVGTLKNALETYKAALAKLNSTTTPAFSGLAATSSDIKILTATATNAAVTGTYAIDVKTLATSSKVASVAHAGGATTVLIPKGDADGSLKITQSGKSYDVAVPAGSTLQQLRDSINAQLQDRGFSANIITDSSGSRLILGSTATGAGSDITTSGVLTIEAGKSMAADGAGYITAAAVDAELTIDGMAVTSKSNTVVDVIGGLTINLITAEKSTVSVSTNTTGLKASVQAFVDAYNNLVKTANSLTKVSTDADGVNTMGPLSGDASVRSILSSIRNELVTPGGNGQLSVLAELGVYTDNAARDGTLTLDTTKFDKAIATKGGQVASLFTGENGLLSRMTNAMNPYSVTGGILDTRSNALTADKVRLNEQQAALDRRIESLTDTLNKKYTAMDGLVAKIRATSNNILTTLNALNNQKSD